MHENKGFARRPQEFLAWEEWEWGWEGSDSWAGKWGCGGGGAATNKGFARGPQELLGWEVGGMEVWRPQEFLGWAEGALGSESGGGEWVGRGRSGRGREWERE